MSTGRITASLPPGALSGEGDLESMITETADDVRRLGVADTMVRSFGPQIVASTSFAPAIAAHLDQAQIAAVVNKNSSLNLRRNTRLFALVVMVSAITFLYFFPRTRVVEHPASQQALTFSVSAIDPALQDRAAVVADEEQRIVQEKQPVEKGPISVAGGRNFAYVREPRLSGKLSFDLVQSSPQTAGRASHGVGFQPVPGSGGRYLSKSGVQWQGAWESNNPAGNIKRGQEYLRYLRSEFRGDVGRSLTARKFGVASPGKSVTLPPARDLPVMKYSK